MTKRLLNYYPEGFRSRLPAEDLRRVFSRAREDQGRKNNQRGEILDYKSLCV